MICPKCGNTCSEGAKFCPQCGKVLQNKCSECGERLTSNDQFCWNCGTKISQSEQDAAVSQITSTSKPKSNYFISTFLLIAIIAATAFCISERLYEEELLMISLLVLSLGMTGLYLLKDNWFRDLNTLGMILVFSGILLFLYGLICSSIIWSRYGVDWDDYEANFWGGLIIIIIGLVIYAFSYKNSRKNTIGSVNQNATQSSKQSDDSESELPQSELSTEPKMDPDSLKELNNNESEAISNKVHWNTVIDGQPYRYATYMSYIGIWLGAIIGVIQTVLIMQYSIIWILSIPSIILMIVAGIGLAEFKHYAYICLMITYWISFFVGLLLLVITAPFSNGTESATYLFMIALQIPFIVYFYKRREAYDR